MKTSRAFMRFYIIPIVLFIGVLLAVGFTGFYTATARTRGGKVISSRWPADFTAGFSAYLYADGDAAGVTEAGASLLRQNGLWLQILDEDGAERFAFDKPDGTPAAYRPYALLKLYRSGESGYSVFVNIFEAAGRRYTYLIGFPINISKAVMYVDTARFRSGKALIFTVVILTAVLVATLSVYSYRTFSLSEKRRRQDEKAKEEWLANITHDLKTPLAPIRGYAELLSEAEALPAQEARRYGRILLKNVLYTEQLVDDLKLTYQLRSNMLPVRAETQNLTRFVRELIIDILNAPEYAGRSIAFLPEREDTLCAFDAQLMRRALTNIIVNALKHNKPDTEVTVGLSVRADVRLTVTDNGGGMTPQELDGLFKRYYRGTSTEVKAEGSGLGMAIAAQIVEAHGGSISARSEAGAGTAVTVELPLVFKV